jgi:DNA polymerase-1
MDTETTSQCARTADLVGLSFAWKPGEAYYIPLRAPAGERTLDTTAVLEALRPIYENAAIGKIGQNLKYDVVVLKRAGIGVAGLHFDTMLASYLLEAGERNHSLDDLAQRHLGHTKIKIADLIGTGKNQKSMAEVSVAKIAAYAAEDADVPVRLLPILRSGLAEQGLDRLMHDLEMPLVEVLADMEYTGVRVHPQRLAQLSEEFGQRLVRTEREIYDLAGREFHIASLKQLQDVLFREQGLPVLRRTKTGPSTDADVLENLAAMHPLPAKIIEHRQYAKLKSTYVDALPAMILQETGRVHASFHQVVAATGRLSSSDPNLQNIPIRTEVGNQIRSAFVPGEEGWRFLAADYSQIELRVLAHFSGDAALCAAFAADEDIHTRVAAEVYGVEPANVTGDMRRKAKAVNFGVIYGQSPFGLAKTLRIEQDEAAQFIDAYFARYSGVEAFMTQTLDFCERQGYVSTILGRRRSIRGVRPASLRAGTAGRQKNLAERTAINTVIQGSAADLIKKAMLGVHRRLKRESRQAKMLL